MMPRENATKTIAEPPALRSALALLARGLWPVPITAPDDDCPSPGKKPLGGKGWGLSRPTEGSLRAAFAAKPRANVGLKLGRSGGVVDLDVDDPERGEETILRLLGGEVAETMGWSNSGGRYHLIFLWDERLARFEKSVYNVGGRGDDFPGVEIRLGSSDPDADKQLQSVVPPSVTDEGEPRVWNGVAAIAPLPDAFFAEMDRVLSAASSLPPRPATRTPSAPAPAAARLRYGLAAMERELAKLAGTPEGGRNDQLNRSAFALGQLVGAGALDFGQVRDELAAVARSIGLHPDEVEATLRSGMEGGKAAPRDLGRVGAGRPTPLTPLTRFIANGDGPHPINRVNGVKGVHEPRDDEEAHPVVVPEWPAPPDDAAYHGAAGEFVRLLLPHTEADPAALLSQLLVGFGNLVGRYAFFRHEDDLHHANTFIALVGPSSKARKGTSWGRIRRILSSIDPDWAAGRVLTGLSSGEGLIWAVRDPITKHEPIKEKGRVVDYQDVEVDAGVADKRLLALESELASVLQSMVRDGNTLSALVRRAWEDGNLRTLTKNSPAVATGAHVSVIGHITRDELRKQLNATEAANGFGNRFLWVCVRRSKSLPFGGASHTVDFAPIVRQLTAAASDASTRGLMTRDAEADDLWGRAYGRLSEGKPGLLGTILGRAEAQVMRLALIYALLDCAPVIGGVHLAAALAFWDYAERSARYIFGEDLGDPDADALLSALRSAPAGLSRSAIREDVFQRNKPAATIAAILGRLLESGLVRREKVDTGGKRPAEVWFAREHHQ